MNKAAAVGSTLIALVMLAGAAPAFAEPMESGKAFTKLTRGAINIVTGWVEVPKRISETSKQSGTAAGFTWGLLRGIGHGFIRTSAGVYEFLTFPFPAPPGYEPVIQPEYVFTEEPSASPYR
ncbi:MAG: exosortase system-associated protein, TIGR04073 family [Candidatus Omnitrophica bacterium]|nr:exosortase system-associated protein, TIGR04073 family [Candidatus Omnitrophota bacterium]